MGRGAWWVMVHRVAKGHDGSSLTHTHICKLKLFVTVGLGLQDPLSLLIDLPSSPFSFYSFIHAKIHSFIQKVFMNSCLYITA